MYCNYLNIIYLFIYLLYFLFTFFLCNFSNSQSNPNTQKLKLFLWLFRFTMEYINKIRIKGLDISPKLTLQQLAYCCAFLLFSPNKASVKRIGSVLPTLKLSYRASPGQKKKRGNVGLVIHSQQRKRNLLLSFYKKVDYMKMRHHF